MTADLQMHRTAVVVAAAGKDTAQMILHAGGFAHRAVLDPVILRWSMHHVRSSGYMPHGVCAFTTLNDSLQCCPAACHNRLNNSQHHRKAILHHIVMVT